MKPTITGRRIAFFAAGSLLLFYLFNAQAIYRYSRVDETRPADCAIVLGAGVSGEKPSPVFVQRLNHGLTLWRQGVVKIVILTGGVSPGNAISDAAIAQRYLLAQGVPQTAIFIEQRSRVTRENLRYAREMMQQHRFASALIVSDPLHMKRAVAIARHESIDAWSSPTTTSRYQSVGAQARFLLRESFYYSGFVLVRPWL